MIRRLRRAPLPLLVYLTALLLFSGCTKFDVLNALVPSCGYTRTTDLAYGGQPRQRLDVYRPHSASPGGAPVVIFFYGGYWQYGEKNDYRFVADALTPRGFVAVF